MMDSEESKETKQQQDEVETPEIHNETDAKNTQEQQQDEVIAQETTEKGLLHIETKSGRQVKLTEKMVAYKEDELQKREKKLMSLYDNWKVKIREIRKTLKEDCCETDLAEMADTIQFTELNVIRQFETLRQAGIMKPETVRKIDALVAINADMIKIVNERLSGIDTFDPTAVAKVLREIKTREYAASIFSSVSTSSERSFNSTRSKISDKVIDASAELAAREAELKLLKIQQEQKEKIIETEMRQKRELEAHQRELEELEVRKQVEVAKARLSVYQKAEDGIDNDNVVADNNNHLSLPKGLESKINATLKNDKSPRTTKVNYNVIPKDRSNVTHQDTEIDSLTETFAQTLQLSRLPVPEPSIFTGDPIKYIEWKMSFDMLIDRKGIPPSEKIFYLKRYVGGEAQKALEGFYYSDSASAYENAKKVLDDRYGHPFITQRAFRERLDKWPKIGTKDPQGLRNFADFLQGCNDAMNFVPSLSVLNDSVENQKLLAKLPDWATVRWNREVNNALETTYEYPPFSKFVEFVVKEAKIACNPVSSLYAIHDKDPKVQKDKPFTSKVRTLTTFSDNKNVKNSSYSTSHNTENRPMKCAYCKTEGHYIVKCSGFLELTIQKKRDFIRENNLCYGCLRSGHLNKDCKRKHTCGTCKKQHPTCLHEEQNPVKHESSTDVKASSFRVSQDRVQGTSMIVPVWVSHKDDPSKEILTYALLDTQSDTTFILNETASALGVDMKPVKLSLSTMTSQNTTIDSSKIKDLKVRAFQSTKSDSVTIDAAYTRDFIPAERSHIPVKETVNDWQHLEDIGNELPPLQSCEVGLLIGYNCPQALAPRKILTGGNTEPYAVQTSLGWSVVGYSKEAHDNKVPRIVHRTVVKEMPLCTPRELINIFEKDFNDNSTTSKKVSQDDLTFLQIMEENITQRSDKHLEMPLPFKERPNLANNKSQVVLRLNHLKRKIMNNPKYGDHYKDFMREIIQRGDAERVKEDSDLAKPWYIPHHGVYHPKKPDKIRVVFDCSARYGNASLNDNLLTGPDLTNGLTGVLCRFRRYPIAIMCDIEKMFHQFYVSEKDRDYLRFLWWENGDLSQEPVEYRMCKHLFGAASSPGCANFALKHLAKLYEDEYPQASYFVQHDFYVDDGLTSVQSETEAIKLVTDAQTICINGDIRLHKFVSNNANVIESVPFSERAVGMNNLSMALETISVERALGVHWNVSKDVFCFETQIKNSNPTRRNILSIVASIFDPLGFLSPFTLKGKRILQEMCRNGLGWDDQIPDSLNDDWQSWINDVDNLKHVEIDRCIIPTGFGNACQLELHHFSDASNSGYGQCTYLRIKGENKIHCSLLIAKARVAPHNVVTIPRLELTAAVLSVKMSLFLKEELNLEIDKEYFWTDSKVVLGYINNEARRFHTFVANRVQIIRNDTHPNQWYYVNTECNPADYVSRGLSALDITRTCWLTGPSFLWQPIVESPNFDPKLTNGDPEVRSDHVATSCLTQTTSCSVLKRLERFSKWSTLVSVITRIKQLHVANKGKVLADSLLVENRRNAEISILKLVQRETFAFEIDHVRSSDLPKTNRLYPLDPILVDGLLCVGGRLRKANLSSANYRHPVILPSDSHITTLILTFVHEQVKHQGRGMTLNSLRSHGYWILGGSKVVARFIRQCVICRRLRRPTEVQRMADLPTERVEPSPPFTYCGMDCFGPFIIKNGRKEVKRYGLLFTCMCSRAVHIEMLDDMTTDAFINGLRCFIAIRGAVRQIRCDQGSNFIGAKNEFERETRLVAKYLAKNQCDFVLNAPHSSHTGGVWERQIRTVRNILNSVLLLCPGRLDDSSLRTIFYEVMSLVNSRPLTVSESNDLEPLTPNHILTSKSEIPYPPPGEFVKEDLFLRKRWRRVQYILEQFWSKWKREYVTEISLRQKWHQPRRNIRINDIVLVKDVDLPRSEWPIAKVVEVQTDDDGLVRRVKVQMSRKDFAAKTVVLERSVHKLVLLLEQ